MTEKESAEYDAIAEKYKESKQLSFRKSVEAYTLFQTLGDIEGHSVLDLACGEGFYTRKLKLAGANSVLGVDISSEMVNLAKREEETNPIGCEYMVHDVGSLALADKYDTVLAMYLLNYAKTKDEILSFCQVVFNVLKTGGKFIGVNDNIRENPNNAPSFIKYGFEKVTPKVQKEGDVVLYKISNEDGSTFEFKNFYLMPATYEWAFREVGFTDFKWIGPYLEPEQQQNPFWDDFMKYPPIIGFEALKV